jgi:hypothetical protein
MSLGVPQYAGNFLTSWRTLLHGLVKPLCVARLVAVQPNTTFAPNSSRRSNVCDSLILCTAETGDETAYISHLTRDCHIQQGNTFRWTSFLRKPNLKLCHRLQHHQMAAINSEGTAASVGSLSLWWPLPHVHCAFYRHVFMQFHGYRVQCYESPVSIQKKKL